jgi:hypothetical protein
MVCPARPRRSARHRHLTLDVYTHLFDDARHAREIRTLMTASPFAALLDTSTAVVPGATVLQLR